MLKHIYHFAIDLLVGITEKNLLYLYNKLECVFSQRVKYPVTLRVSIVTYIICRKMYIYVEHISVRSIEAIKSPNG